VAKKARDKEGRDKEARDKKARDKEPILEILVGIGGGHLN